VPALCRNRSARRLSRASSKSTTQSAHHPSTTYIQCICVLFFWFFSFRHGTLSSVHTCLCTVGARTRIFLFHLFKGVCRIECLFMAFFVPHTWRDCLSRTYMGGHAFLTGRSLPCIRVQYVNRQTVLITLLIVQGFECVEPWSINLCGYLFYTLLHSAGVFLSWRSDVIFSLWMPE